MRNTNRKRGFTIIELVVVIAVIAVLAGVLIPTFSGVIKRSKESSDESAVRNMNTVLSADGAVTPTKLDELYDVLAENDIKADSFKPLLNDRYFFWDSEANVVLYTDKSFKVHFPASQKNNTNTGAWISLSGKIPTASVNLGEVISADGVATINATDAVLAGQQLTAVMAALEKGTAVSEIILPAEVNLMGADVMIDELNQPLTIKSSSTNSTITGLVVNEGAREKPNTVGTDRVYYAGLIGYAKANVTIQNITLSDSIVGGKAESCVGAFVGSVDNAKSEITLTFTNVHLKNTTVRGLQKVGSFFGFVTNADKVIIDDKSSATDVAVEVTSGLAGGIFGYINNDAGDCTVTVGKPANFDSVELKLATVSTGHYFQYNGMYYGLDLEANLVPAEPRDSGWYRYFPAMAKYGFIDGGLRNKETPIDPGFLTYEDKEKVILAYGAVGVNATDANASMTWTNISANPTAN